MNKTIIININGFVFHIEEDAYEILKSYMTDVKRHFLNSADSHEITTDIENRIAEMFTEILARDNKQAVVEQDVTAVIEQMGSVEDFEYADEEGAPADNYTYNNGTRTLFRDNEDHLLGGVCAGLANYFGAQPIWIRLAFVLLSFLAGSGLILYIILWIVIPRALTRADRMAMKGQQLNLQGFKQNLEDELSGIRNNLSGLGQEAKPLVYKTRDFFSDFFHHLGVFFNSTGKVFVKLFGIALLITCFGLLIALIVSIIAFLAYGKMGLYHIFPFNILEHDLNSIILCSAFLLLAIPLFTLIMVSIGIVFNSNGLRRGLGSTLFIIWMVTLGIIIYYTARISANFRHSASFSQNISIKPTGNNTYYLKLNDIRYISPEDSIRYQIKDRFKGKIILNNEDDDDFNDFDSPGNVTITIEKSDVNQPVLVESFSARGFDYGDALVNAQNTTYQFSQQDSVLKFNRRLEKPLNRLWRDQEIHLTLKVPVNAVLIIDKSMERYIRDHNLYECAETNKKENSPTAPFIMTNDGLECKVDTLVTTTPAVKTDK